MQQQQQYKDKCKQNTHAIIMNLNNDVSIYRDFEKAKLWTIAFKNIHQTVDVAIWRASQRRWKRVSAVQSVLCKDAWYLKKVIVKITVTKICRKLSMQRI